MAYPCIRRGAFLTLAGAFTFYTGIGIGEVIGIIKPSIPEIGGIKDDK